MDGVIEDLDNMDLEVVEPLELPEGPPPVASIYVGQIFDPLEIDLILAEVMGNMTYDTLRPCFSVSKMWRKKAFEEMKSREVTRNVGPDLKDIDKLYEEVTTKTAKGMKLIKLAVDKHPLDTPRLQATLKMLSPYLDALALNADMEPLELLKCLKELPNITELSILPLGNIMPDGRKLNYPIQDTITSEFLVLENICFLDIISDPKVEQRNNPDKVSCLSYICKTFPNLVALSVYNLVPESPRNFKDTSVAKLRHLKIIQHFGITTNKTFDRSLDMLSKIGLQLRRLQFEFQPLPDVRKELPGSHLHREPIDTIVFRNFVESQRETLQALDIVQHEILNTNKPSHVPNICPFPLDLPHLKALHIQKPFIRNLVSIFNALPSLLEVKICLPTGFDWKRILPAKMKKAYPNLRVLRVDYMDSSMFGVMSKYFPSLRVLQINKCDKADRGVFNDIQNHQGIPENMTNCFLCGNGQFNIHMSRDHHKRFDYMVVERDPKISKALEHWTSIDTLIAGNCIHAEPAICFIMDKELVKGKAYLDTDIEALGFYGMYHWARWEAFTFRHSHTLKPFDWMCWTGLVMDAVFVPFDNRERQKLHDLIVKLSKLKVLIGRRLPREDEGLLYDFHDN